MRGDKRLILLVFALVFFMLFVGIGSSYVCWDYDDDEVACDAKSDCRYHSETWGGWCEELNCWSLSSTECTNTTLTTEIGKNCQWKNSNNYGWCMQKNCWSFKGTNESYCETDGGLNCAWEAKCNGWNPDTNCWDLGTQNECSNVSGCYWGECTDKGCWNYQTAAYVDAEGYSCTNATGARGLTCLWNSGSSYCYEPSCWDYGGTSSNETYCEDSAARGISCVWVDNYYVHDSCEEASCWHSDYTNQSWCENSSLNGGVNCSWSSTSSMCTMQGCWNHWEQSACQGDSACAWETSTGSGWCEEIQCWSYDTWSGGNHTFCVNSTLNNGLTCQWTNDSYTDTVFDGWCNPVITETCASFTSERECMDSYWCWWEYVDWNNVSLGGTCKEPQWTQEGLTAADDIFTEWNPGCYIFDMNATECNYTVGCNHADGQCADVGNEDNLVFNISSTVLEANGINCSLINNSQLCANIPALATCCEWNGVNCTSKLGKSCWENADREQQSLGVTACADVGVQTSNAQEGENLCQQITGSPLYMPCVWSNATKTCDFKASDVFGNRTQSFALIDNKKNCNAAGGKWIQEFYCEGNRSVPAGRCEQKGTDERNCNKACFACEYDFNGAAHNSSTVAKEYCYDSNLGYCEFIADTSAVNGFGLCRAKDEFVKGVATDCRYDCGSCTYYGNPNASTYSDARADLTPPIPTTFDICNTPKCYCEYAKDFNVTCKWITDSASTEIGGYCVSSSEKTCEDSCDRCYTQDNCLDIGRSSFNASGSCEWANDACTKRSGGEGVAEICWDGIDNDGDNLIDCADSGCFADSFCGFVSGDCFGWVTEATCKAAQLDSGLNCSWVTDPWGSWCDFPGADCWKSDGNETDCILKNASCEYNNGTGNGWCEQDWSVGESCYNKLTETTCTDEAGCTWTNDTWCSGEGADNEWCQNSAGGWCDPDAFAPSNCYQYDGNESGCNGTQGGETKCYYSGSYCMEKGCWNYDSNSTLCNLQSDCAWEYSEWQGCQVDWSSMPNCWQFGEGDCADNGCVWRTGDGWSGCDNNISKCWDYTTENTCGNNSKCYWDESMWNWRTDSYGSCDAACYNRDLTEGTCGALDYCRWNDGWCMSNITYGGGTSGVDCWQYTDNTTVVSDLYVCGNATGCKWKNDGWCNPKGFQGGGCATGMGGGAMTGMECWKYDGDETRCTNSSDINITCNWMPESRPFCEPDWSADCWRYYDNTTVDVDGYVCGNVSGCYWTQTGGDSEYCANVFDQCWNSTYSDENENNTLECNANPNCAWTTGSWDTYYTGGGGSGWCEPSCFSATTEATCTGSCKWMSGWCNTPGMYEMFGGMEAGAPVMIAIDATEDNTTVGRYLDLMGVGMRDMDDSFGFASGTASFADAGICNNQKIGFSFGGANNFGKGNNTVKYYVYLDTDGSTTGGCALNSDSSAAGYEFFFKYISTYNATLGKATETFNAQKCGSSGWITADISLNAWKEKMCGEIQGPMVAVDKSALEKFPNLYDAEKDMRVAVAIAGANNNATSPSDAAGPGWVTPGAIDFTLTGFFDLGAGGATFEEILMGGGYVKYEDCYNTVDDDNDNLVDCDDWDCEFTPHCESSGVNVVGYADTSMPRITGIKVEEYTDAALVFYTTDKPTNGTLTFWHNDSTCSANNTKARTIEDSTGLTTVRDFVLWHDAHIYNDTGINSLDYNLTNDTTYYYRLKVCDSGNKCSTSACSSLRTAEMTKCGYCNFVTIISPPTGWQVNYDLDTDGTYEHLQGSMCGPKAGMKTNYTSGRKAHIKLNNSDGVEMLFYNVSLTKTGLTGDTRTISASGDLIHDTSLTDVSGGALEMVGMATTTRDKIINNLHPEVCKILMLNDDCSELWHCDNSGANCQRRDNATTGAATGVASGTSCLWTIPYCEF